MFFSKSFVAAAILCMSLSLQAHAHAAIAPAMGVQGTPVRADVQRPSRARPCGRVKVAKTFDSSTPIAAASNGSFAATITNFNPGVDGSLQVTAQVDPTGTGKNFVQAEVLQNGPLNPPTLESAQLVVQLPAGMTCSGGASGNKCLVAFKTAGNFGNCVVIQQDGAAAAAADKNNVAGVAATGAGTDATGTNTDASASSATAPATATATTGVQQQQQGNKANAKAGQDANDNDNANANAVSRLKGVLQGLQEKRAVGTRAARIARRAAEHPAVEVLA